MIELLRERESNEQVSSAERRCFIRREKMFDSPGSEAVIYFYKPWTAYSCMLWGNLLEQILDQRKNSKTNHYSFVQ